MNTDKIPMLNLARLHESLGYKLEQAFSKALKSGQFIMGESVTNFEGKLKNHVNVKNAVAVKSGTDALYVSLMALGVKPQDEIITTPFSFFATAGSIARLGARPVFVDIDPVTFNIYPEKIKAAITSRTTGILPVHLFGQCCDMDPVLKLADEHNLWVLEDAAQAIGAKHMDSFAGSMGNAGTFSFFPAKNLGALGDAGAVVTNDNDLADKISVLRAHGAREKYHHEFIGGNFRMDAIQAAFLEIKLAHLKNWEEKRRKTAKKYRKAFKSLNGITLPVEKTGNHHVYNQFVLRVRDNLRDKLKEHLEKHGVSTAVYYPVPLHMQPCFSYLEYKKGAFPIAQRAALEALAIPVDPTLNKDQTDKIISVVKDFFV